MKVSRGAILSMVCLFGLGSPVGAAEWWYIDTPEDGRVNYIDAETIVVTGSSVRLWVYSILLPSKTPYKSYKALLRIECKARTIEVLSSVRYLQDGSSLTENPVGLIDVPPESSGEHLLKFGCSQPSNRPKMTFRLAVPPEDLTAAVRAAQASGVTTVKP